VNYSMRGTAQQGVDYRVSGTPGQVTIGAGAVSEHGDTAPWLQLLPPELTVSATVALIEAAETRDRVAFRLVESLKR
jgi:hypothetical protein